MHWTNATELLYPWGKGYPRAGYPRAGYQRTGYPRTGSPWETPSRPGAAVERTTLVLPLDISKRFGLRLRQLRSEHHYTQLRIAWDCGVELGHIRNVEEGKEPVSLATIEVIASGMHFSLPDLLKDLESPTTADFGKGEL